jgi:hypothetical protein|uniref:Uncharacterized protein n=1 Tax=Populus trichocarpa TaxID=3694 RepID=A9PHW5_POPTR|nr:unknown [Populus trichocarpa]
MAPGLGNQLNKWSNQSHLFFIVKMIDNLYLVDLLIYMVDVGLYLIAKDHIWWIWACT